MWCVKTYANEIETVEQLDVVAFAALAGQVLGVVLCPQARHLALVDGRQGTALPAEVIHLARPLSCLN